MWLGSYRHEHLASYHWTSLAKTELLKPNVSHGTCATDDDNCIVVAAFGFNCSVMASEVQ